MSNPAAASARRDDDRRIQRTAPRRSNDAGASEGPTSEANF
jgi:hypothetical protein